MALLRNEFLSGGDVEGLQAKLREMRANVLARYLTPSQVEQVDIQTSPRGSGDRGQVATVYVLNDDGVVVPRRISIGVSDDRFTEVRRGLNETDQVITRMRRTSG